MQNIILYEITFNPHTRLHSSRMHTACLLTVSSSMHCAGGVGVSVPGGGQCLLLGVVSQHALRQTPLWTEFLKHATENITLSQTSIVGGKDEIQVGHG